MATVAEELKSSRPGKKVEDVGQLSQTALMYRRFMKNKLSVIGAVILIFMYLVAIFADFVVPYPHDIIDPSHQLEHPTKILWVNGLPHIQGYTQVLDKDNFKWNYVEDPTKVYPIKLFVQGEPWTFLGLFTSRLRLFGADTGGDDTARLFLWGADRNGRDVFTRTLKGAQISLTIGFIGVGIQMILGSVIGTASGYFGGWIDNIAQRIIELIQTFPFISIFVAIAAALPTDMPVLQRYMLITGILALIGWTGLSREVRGKVLSYRAADYTAAAVAAGASHWRVITTHMVPNALSHIIVVASFAIPGAIASETALSFLNLGILPPAVSWGVLLQDAQQVRTVLLYPWQLIPLAAIILASIALYLLGDGLRDAVDPYAQ